MTDTVPSENNEGYNYVVVHEDRIESYPVDFNLQYVKNLLYERENPHPLVPVAIFAGILILIYLIYTVSIKHRITGEWAGQLGDYPGVVSFRINHNVFTNTIAIIVDGYGVIADGELLGNAIVINLNGRKIAGVVVDRNKIVWVDSGDVWKNIKVLN